MQPKYRFLAMLLLIAGFLSGCGLFAVQEQHEKIASYCQIYGSVKPEIDNGKKMIVALFKVAGPDIRNPKNWSVFDHFVVDGPGKWYFSTAPGDYRLGAFKDVNGDLIYQLDEPVFAPVRGELIQCRAGEVKTGNDLVIPEQGRSNAAAPVDISKLQVRSAKQQLDISLGQVAQVGAIAALDEPRFADAVAEQSLWKPLDFLIEGNAGIYFLEPYSAQKMPVLFVHGINGTPLNFDYLIRHLDRSRYQPWVVYYPSGAYIDNVARYLDQMLQQLQARYQFDKMAVIAHSMGGLVSRSFILKHLETVNHLAIPLFVSISTPWNGHAAAKLGVDHAPTPVYSWEDLAPGSRFLHDLFYTGEGADSQRRKLPETMSKHLLFSFIETEAGDGTVSLASELRAEAQEEADRIYGYPHSHMGILNAPETANQLNRLLDSVR
ncbi:alpha/beta hydrolase [Methylomonas sp. MO1]|uniref:esterase/lipase family protein n=1 Tax=Methylomonas sp. MO1 TaxID=3073619 RepID=UPI0028A315BE|nr:alpha/beta fold hydrolase [Methylomonas sp. MO1]MDT4290332.1 alpha/beta hydrolase [Methylomonas sp. MO1]